jgi:hypothetical protein
MGKNSYGNASDYGNIVKMKYGTADSTPISETKAVISAADCISCTKHRTTMPRHLQCIATCGNK